MKKRLLILLFVVFLPLLSFAQSSLTIFSEDGDKFFLVLNGQKQNTIAQTNIRIDGLSQPYYQAKVIFEDPAKPAIEKNLPTQDPGTNAYADVTYKIKHTKNGELKMRYFSATPVQPNYAPPADVYVMHYGDPAPPSDATVTRSTTTTTTTVAQPNNVSMGVNTDGMNMNVNMQAPDASATTVTRSTTTTTTSYSENGGGGQQAYYDHPHREHEHEHEHEGCRYPMDWNDFKAAKESIAKSGFDETKLSTAKTILNSNCLNTEQVVQICKLFGFEESKLDFAKAAYSRTTDRNNYFKVNDVFGFDASKTDLNNYISSMGR